MIILLFLINGIITPYNYSGTHSLASSVEQDLSEASSFITDTNGIEMDSFYFESIESNPDSNNIIHYKLNSSIGDKNRIISSLDLHQENPFAKSPNRIIPNAHPAPYFFVCAPGDGSKISMKDILRSDVLASMPDTDKFEKGICLTHFDILSKSHIAIGYSLDFHFHYNEYFGNGYAVSYIKVFDINSKLIYQKQVNGALIGNPLVSSNGSCLVYVSAVTPYWDVETKHILTVIRIKDNETVYYEEFDNIKGEESTLWLEGGGNTIGVMINKFPPSRLIFIDASNKIVYRIKNDLLQQYHIGRLIAECYELNLSDGIRKICFIEDFYKFRF